MQGGWRSKVNSTQKKNKREKRGGEERRRRRGSENWEYAKQPGEVLSDGHVLHDNGDRGKETRRMVFSVDPLFRVLFQLDERAVS